MSIPESRWELAPGALVDCPTCGLPARIVKRFTLDGAPGPVEHVKVICVGRHWCALPVDMFPFDVPVSDHTRTLEVAQRR